MRSTPWLAFVALAAAVGIGIVSYDLGVSHGAAQAAAAAGNLPPYAYGLGWYRPWGFGFGFPILFFLFFWLFIGRVFFWGGPWRRGWRGSRDVPPSFDAWHRRAHERMTENPAPPKA